MTLPLGALAKSFEGGVMRRISTARGLGIGRSDGAPSGVIVSPPLSGWRLYPHGRNPIQAAPARADNPRGSATPIV